MSPTRHSLDNIWVHIIPHITVSILSFPILYYSEMHAYNRNWHPVKCDVCISRFTMWHEFSPIGLSINCLMMGLVLLFFLAIMLSTSIRWRLRSMSEGRQNSCSDNSAHRKSNRNKCKLDGTTVQVQMQDKISYCPAPLGRSATPYTVPSVQFQAVIMAFLNASIVVRLTMYSGSVFHSRTFFGKNENLW